jgi:hypothetical protein
MFFHKYLQPRRNTHLLLLKVYNETSNESQIVGLSTSCEQSKVFNKGHYVE